MIEDLMRQHNIGAYLSRTGDEHLSEYIGDSDKRVKFLTGFTGSNGIAVTCSQNALYTDSRYYIQAERELKDYKLMKTTDAPLDEYLGNVLEIRRVGLCTKLFSDRFVKNLKEKLSKRNIELIPFENDLVDACWEDKPNREFREIYSIEELSLFEYFEKNLGEEKVFEDLLIESNLSKESKLVSKKYKEKLEEVRNIIEEDEILIVSELDTIAWLFNLRGSDIEYNPVFYSFSAISKKECLLFTNGSVTLEGVETHPYDSFYTFLKGITLKVVFSGGCNAFISHLFPNHRMVESLRKIQSVKGGVEVEGFNLAYILDGIALTKLFEFVEKFTEEGEKGISEKLTEKGISEKLNEIKSNFVGYNGPSFGTIAGVGENSAVVHYEAGDKEVTKDTNVLIDSGSNYFFGTTDTTRTLFLGEPPEEFKKDFTRVLKGQLRTMCGIFPVGVSGGILDGLTRLDLWKEKKSYGHAAGHGVGHFLCVHESPPTLYPGGVDGVIPNQIFSVEPGYYKDGEYGIRIENLVLSQDIGDGFMQFKNITYVPYQLNCIDLNLLSDEEIEEINKISQEIRRVLGKFIKEGEDGFEYLMRNTERIIK